MILIFMGKGIGPLIGSIIYPIIGFLKTMYLFGFFLFLGIIMGFLFIPSYLNETATDEEVAELEKLDEEVNDK